LAKLEKQASAPDFWNDQEKAQKVLQQRSRLERALDTAENQQRLVEDIAVLFDFAAEDDASANELRESISKLAADVEESETQMLLGGPTDANNAFLSINSGAGGTDAQDFAEMLLRMYLRWAQKRGFKTEETCNRAKRPGSNRPAIASKVITLTGCWQAKSAFIGWFACHRSIQAKVGKPVSLRFLSRPKLMRTSKSRSWTKTCALTLIVRPEPEASTSTLRIRRFVLRTFQLTLS
jgi:hypothetical protein